MAGYEGASRVECVGVVEAPRAKNLHTPPGHCVLLRVPHQLALMLSTSSSIGHWLCLHELCKLNPFLCPPNAQ